MEEQATGIYTVKTGSFEGPLELLLSLIEQRKLFINEVSLSNVTTDYLAYVKELPQNHEERQIPNLSAFVLIASTLILIKSRSLLPSIELSTEEEDTIQNLEHRLKLYQIIKDIGVEIKNMYGVSVIYFPPERLWGDVVFVPDTRIQKETLHTQILSVLSAVPKKEEPLPSIEIKKVIHIDEMMSNLSERIQTAISVSFKEFSQSHNSENEKENRVNIIVSFLAMLELVREGLIDVIQHQSFEDIQINKQNPSNSI